MAAVAAVNKKSCGQLLAGIFLAALLIASAKNIEFLGGKMMLDNPEIVDNSEIADKPEHPAQPLMTEIVTGIALPAPPLSGQLAKSQADVEVKRNPLSANKPEPAPTRDKSHQIEPSYEAATNTTTITTTITTTTNTTFTLADKPELGEQLLQQQERGYGPAIEIAWPSSAMERRQLFNTLHRCLGVKVANLRDGRIVAVEDSLHQQPMSGFLRAVNGDMSLEEQRLRKQLPFPGQPVRLFPRELDVRLLSALGQLIGTDYQQTKFVRARYRLSHPHLQLTGISTDQQRYGNTLHIIDTGHCKR